MTLKNINSLTKAVEIDHLTNVDDVTAPVAGKFLQRRADGLGYDWVYPTTQTKQSSVTFTGTAKQQIRATLQQDGPIISDDYWKLILDGVGYAASSIGDVSDEFVYATGTVATNTGGLWDIWSEVNSTWNNTGLWNPVIVDERLRMRSDGGLRLGLGAVYTKSNFVGGFIIETTVEGLDTAPPGGYAAVGFAMPTDIAGVDNVYVTFTLGAARSFELSYDVSPTNDSTPITRGGTIGAGVSMGGEASVSLRFTYDGTTMLVEFSYNNWQTAQTLTSFTLGDYMNIDNGVKFQYFYHAGSTDLQWSYPWYVSNFKHKTYNGGYVVNSSRPLRTLEQITTELKGLVAKDYDTAYTTATAFTIAKKTFGTFTYSYDTYGTDSVDFVELQPGHVMQDSDIWMLAINGTPYQRIGTQVATIDDVTDYFVGVIDALDGIIATKTGPNTLLAVSEVPGLDFSVVDHSSEPGMINVISSSDTLQQAYTDLVDTPDNYISAAGNVPVVKQTLDGMEFKPFKFITLEDTPSTLTGNAQKIVAVNPTADGLEFIDQANSVLSMTDAVREVTVIDQGVLVYTTDTKKVYAGDGVTLGGNIVAGGGVDITTASNVFGQLEAMAHTFPQYAWTPITWANSSISGHGVTYDGSNISVAKPGIYRVTLSMRALGEDRWTAVRVHDGTTTKGLSNGFGSYLSSHSALQQTTVFLANLDNVQSAYSIQVGRTDQTVTDVYDTSDPNSLSEVTPYSIVATLELISDTLIGLGKINAVTEQDAAAHIAVPDTNYVDINTLTITTSGAPVLLLANMHVNTTVAGLTWGYFIIERNGVNLGPALGLFSSEVTNTNVPVAFHFLDSPPAGTHTYTVRAAAGAGSFEINEIGDSSIVTAIEQIAPIFEGAEAYFAVHDNASGNVTRTGVIPFNTIEADNLNGFDVVNYKYVIKKSGLYVFGGNFYSNSTPSTSRQRCLLRKNGSIVIQTGQYGSGEHFSSIVYCDVGDEITLDASGFNLTYYAAAAHNRFWGALIGNYSGTGAKHANELPVDASGFSGNLATTDDTVQKVANKVDALTLGALGALLYQGAWNADTNTPTMPAAATENLGHYYVVSVSGATDVDGVTDWAANDWLVSNGTSWDKIDNTEIAQTILTLGDTPASYGSPGQVLKVNTIGDGVEFGDAATIINFLADISDVPPTVANKVLQRNASNTGYDWVDNRLYANMNDGTYGSFVDAVPTTDQPASAITLAELVAFGD